VGLFIGFAMIGLFGGTKDPNIASLYQVLQEAEVPFLPVLVGQETIPEVLWDLSTDRLILNGQEIRPAALFHRFDVFASLGKSQTRHAQVWHELLYGWALAHEDVVLFNRNHQRTNKLAVLMKATELGLKPPYSVVTNQATLLSKLEGTGYISKPVPGGDQTRLLSEALQDPLLHKIPMTIQPRLVQPELRIYGIRGIWAAFWMKTESLDYRVQQDVEIIQTDIPTDLVEKLAQLMAFMHLDFAAADFKTDPESGELRFLEINSSPMFARFDLASGFTISKAIIQGMGYCTNRYRLYA